MAETPRTREEIFKILREFFEDNNVDIKEHDTVWAVLTALRGPDEELDPDHTRNGNDRAKGSTTAVIRERLLGAEVGYRICADVNEDNDEHVKWRTQKIPPGHFKNHAQRAFTALGLSWDSVNE